MRIWLLAAAEQAVTEPEAGSVLEQALHVTGVGMLGIFIVMGLFAAMITLLTALFPGGDQSQ